MNIQKNQYISWFLGACVLLVSMPVCAAGLFYPDVGTVALGRGSAFAARADDLSAFYYNPAGLSKSKGINVLLGANFNDLNVDFQRRGAEVEGLDEENGEWFLLNDQYYINEDFYIAIGNPQLDYANGASDAQEFRSVSQETPLIANALTAIGNWGDAFGLEGLSIAGGIMAPSGYTKHRYPKEGPQRYSLYELDNTILYPGLGVSYAFNRYFQFGAVFLWGMVFGEKAYASRTLPLPQDSNFNENLEGDVGLLSKYKDMFMPTGIIGVLSNPLDWLELGVSVHLPATMEAEGTIEYTPSEVDAPDSAVVEGHDKVTVKQTIVMKILSGVRYIHEYFDIELDFVWENWASNDGILLELDFIVDPNPNNDTDEDQNVIPDNKISKDYQNTYSFRLGSDIEVWPENLTFRLGGFYQSSAYVDEKTFSVDFPYWDQFGASFGVTWHAFGMFDFTAGYLHIFQPSVTVTDGTLQQNSGTQFDAQGDGSLMLATGNTVNNGTYDVNFNILALAVEGHF
ncbi:MAG: outer membrane protein transport protein [Myxococcota bacterium]|nr:outer membrane protein transport protein [Myxococcota bacterium]